MARQAALVEKATAVHEFEVDTQLRHLGDGRSEAELTDRWDTPIGRPNGGYLLALVVAAMAAEVPFPDPLAVSAFYLRPGRKGPAQLSVDTVRVGRTVATAQASLVQEGKEVVRALGTFGDVSEPGRRIELGAPPDLPPPEECTDFVGPLAEIPITARFECRGTHAPPFMTGGTGDPMVEVWLRFRDGREIDVAALPLIVDSIYPPVFEVGGISSASTLELTLYVRARPVPGWVSCRATSRHLSAGYCEEDFEVWDSDGVLVAQSRQLSRVTTTG